MILCDDPIDAYHGRLRESPPTYSHTGLRFGQEHGMLALRRLMDGLLVIEDKECWALGRLFETRLCHGREHYLTCVAIKPADHDGRTKDGKAWNAENAGRVRISADEDAMIEDMVLALMEIPEVTGILDASSWQQQTTLTANIAGINVQARPDFLFMRDGQAITVDLKTCAALGKLTSGRGIADFGYHTQAALAKMCLRNNGLDVTQSFVLAVEKSNPSRAALIELSPMFVDLGEYDVRTWIDTVKACTDSGVWPRVAQTSFVVEPPAWMTKE